MTTAELAEDQEALLRRMATPARLAIYASKEITGFQWDSAAHLQLMEERILDGLLDFSRQRFISISMPPRHGKSFYCSVFLAAWFLGMYPEKRVILVTYSDDFAAMWGKLVRDVLTRYGKELFGRTVARDATSKTDWMMERSVGGMLAVGIGGGITGRGGDLIIIDDLIKNQQEARSNATKQLHRDEYDSSIRPRLEPGGTIVCVATRWAPDDLPGHLHEPNLRGDQWEYLDFPALAEVPRDYDGDFELWEDELGRHVHQIEEVDENGDPVVYWQGDPLWPGRWSLEALVQIRHTLQEFVWNALYQQNPRLTEGSSFTPDAWGEFPAYESHRLKNECLRLVRSWDLAASKDKGDYTVGALMGRHPDGRVYVFDVRRGQWAPADVERNVLECAEEDGGNVKILIEQERAGAGKTVIDGYRRKLLGRYVEGPRPDSSKDSRAHLYAAQQANGLLMLPDRAVWKQKWIDEHKDFGYIKHDDQVDAGAQGFNELASTGSGTMVFSPLDYEVVLTDPMPQLITLLNRS